MNNRLIRFVNECDVRPRGYGLAYTAHYSYGSYYAPVPLNLVIRLAHDLWYRLVRGPKQRDYLANIRHLARTQGYQHGYDEGYTAGMRHTMTILRERENDGE
jgi:hypothetical protein